MNTDVQNTFKALSDPTRRSILMHLSQQDMSIGEVSSYYDMTRAAVKKHLGILERGNLIQVRKQGRERINSLKPDGLKTLHAWMKFFDRYWDKKLNKLEAAINAYQDQNNE